MSAQRVPDSTTLITATPDEGRQLAGKMALLFARTTSVEPQRDNQRHPGADDVRPLLPVDQVAAISFAMIAIANDYWRRNKRLLSLPASLAHLSDFGPAPPRARGLAPWRVQRAKALMRERVERGVALAELADACGLSAGTFASKFRRSTGTSPHQWLMQCRVEHAIGLMKGGSQPLSDIAMSSGFADQAHFTRVFSARMGVSPGVWRARYSGTEA